MTYKFYEKRPNDLQGQSLYKVVERRKSTDPKVGELEAKLYLSASGQTEAVYAIARDLGAGKYIPVLLER